MFTQPKPAWHVSNVHRLSSSPLQRAVRYERADGVQLTASDAAPGDYFGWPVSLSGDHVIVGVRGNDDAGGNSGSAYVFGRKGATWLEEAKITASDTAAEHQFGRAVVIQDKLVIVGGPFDDDAARDSGSTYVFEREGMTRVNATNS